MPMYYPVVSKSSLTPSNPSYGALLTAIDDLDLAQDDFWDSREDYWNDLGENTSRRKVIDRTKDQIGQDRPWNYRTLFRNLNPGGTNDPRNQFYVRVESDYPGREELYDLDDDDRLVRYNPRRYAAQMQTGNPREDTLFQNNDRFTGRGTPTSYYISFGGVPVAVNVFDKYEVPPYAFSRVTGYNQQKLQLLNIYGQAWYDNCNSALQAYFTAFVAYNNNAGGGINEDYFSGDVDQPWDDYRGDPFFSYMRPEDLPIPLRREIRGNA